MHCPATKFSEFDDLIADQGDVAIVIEIDPDTHRHFYISAYMPFGSTSPLSQDILYSYLTACDPSFLKSDLTSSMYMSHDSDSHFAIQVPTSAYYSTRSSNSCLLYSDSYIHSLPTLIAASTL